MKTLMIGLLAATVLGAGGYAAAAGLDDTQPARTVSIPAATTADGTTTGTTTTGTTTAGTTTAADDIVIGNAPAATTTNGVDVSGPCDEAEHANDPRCTGAAGATGDDDNSGPGSGDDNDDNSGHGSGSGSGDDGDDDRSGSNSGSDDNDNSDD